MSDDSTTTYHQTAPDQNPKPQVGDRFGDYVLVEDLGHGGMGTIWKAEHFQLGGLIVAVKFIRPDQLEFGDKSLKLLERFKKEIKTLNEVRHPNIVNIVTCNWDHQPPFYVMDYVTSKEGKPQDLRKIIAAGEISLEDVLKWTKQAASALEAAHKKGVYHRDIKPANILLDTDGNVRVCDFGLAKVQNGEESNLTLTPVGTKIGTQNYASPEQWRGENVNQQADIFSLGYVFYEMLTGEHASSTPPSAIRKGVTTAWDNVYQKMTFPKLEGRFQTMAEVLEALDALREQKTVSPAFTVVWSTIQAIPDIVPLVKQGYKKLEDSHWEQAGYFFKNALIINAEYAPAHIGLLCVELRVPTEEQLSNYPKPFSDNNHFRKAVKYADSNYRQRIEGYDQAIRERLRQEQYNQLVRLMENASEDDYRSVAADFRAMDGYKDTAVLAEECDKRYQTLKVEREECIRKNEEERRRQAEEEQKRKEAEKVESNYQSLVRKKNGCLTEPEYLTIAAGFRQLEGYKDSAALAEECVEQNKKLKDERKEENRALEIMEGIIIAVNTGLFALLPWTLQAHHLGLDNINGNTSIIIFIVASYIVGGVSSALLELYTFGMFSLRFFCSIVFLAGWQSASLSMMFVFSLDLFTIWIMEDPDVMLTRDDLDAVAMLSSVLSSPVLGFCSFVVSKLAVETGKMF